MTSEGPVLVFAIAEEDASVPSYRRAMMGVRTMEIRRSPRVRVGRRRDIVDCVVVVVTREARG